MTTIFQNNIILAFILDWGSAADWCMVVVASLTAAFLYKTLRSQQEVQKTQTRLFEIEGIRFRESIKPVLRYSASKDKFIPGDKDKNILTIKVVNETDRIALEINPNYPEGGRAIPIAIPIDFPARQTHLEKGGKPLLLNFLIESDPKASDHIVFGLNYQDIAGTKYKQGVFCFVDSQGIVIHPFLPEVVT